jgi:hypothetical protein
MENNQQNSPKIFSEKGQGKNKQFQVHFELYEEVLSVQNFEPQRVILLANYIWIEDENGNVRKTEQGKHYKVTINNGQISFDKPLKFQNNG